VQWADTTEQSDDALTHKNGKVPAASGGGDVDIGNYWFLLCHPDAQNGTFGPLEISGMTA
jgi:hypothetical protein